MDRTRYDADVAPVLPHVAKIAAMQDLYDALAGEHEDLLLENATLVCRARYEIGRAERYERRLRAWQDMSGWALLVGFVAGGALATALAAVVR